MPTNPGEPSEPPPPPTGPEPSTMPTLQQVQLYLLTLLRQLPATGRERTAITDAMDVVAAHPFLPEPTTTH